MTTALIYDDIYLEHKTPARHPESPERLRAIMRELADQHLLEHPNLLRLAPRPATDDELAAVHSREHIATIEALSKAAAEAGRVRKTDPDTAINARSAEVARYAAGGVLVAVDAVMDGRADSAFAVVRPPGHHAEEAIAMGFCLYNNVAVAARYAQQRYGVGKVLIVDFDVHHGNGTQHMFYTDPNIAYFSIHQLPFYPGPGAYDEIGEGEGRFTTCNAPVPADTTFDLYNAIFREILYAFTDRFRPDLILVSAGYDAHWRDPLANVLLDVLSYAVFTRYLQDLAQTYCNGRLIFSLEGGYDTGALAEGVAATVTLLLGEQTVRDTIGPSPTSGTRWNAEWVTDSLRDMQQLVGYRRRPRLRGPIMGADDEDEHEHDHDEDGEFSPGD